MSHTAVLVERQGRFFIYEPGLGVIAPEETVGAAYQKVAEARQSSVAEIERAGLALQGAMHAIQGPGPGSVGRPPTIETRTSVSRERGVFVAKAAVVVLVGAPFVLALSRAIGEMGSAVSAAIAPVGKLSLVDVSRKAADIARDARDLPGEQKEALRQSIDAISREAAPIIDAWRSPPEPSSPPPRPQ